jgi:Cdc6-like AAA superfamily ATPase
MRQILRFVALSAFVLALTAVPNSKPLLLILIGARGSGKNTESDYLQEARNSTDLSR